MSVPPKQRSSSKARLHPGGAAEFNAWLDNFVTYTGANLGLVAGDLTPITTAQAAWAGALAAHVTAQQAAQERHSAEERRPRRRRRDMMLV